MSDTYASVVAWGRARVEEKALDIPMANLPSLDASDSSRCDAVDV